MTASLITSPTPSFQSPVAESLIADWDRLRHSALHLQRVKNWNIAGLAGPFADLDETLTVLGRFGAPDDSHADQLFAAVVAHAAIDDFAATVALHRILPALVAVARRRGGQMIRHQRIALGELLPHAWIVIRTYPIGRRPVRVAAGLVRDIEYQAFVRDRRLRSATEESTTNDTLPVKSAELHGRIAGTEHPMDAVIAVIDEARARGVDDDDLRFALAWASGADSRALAETFGISDRTVRNRRSAVAARLRDALGADAA